MTSVSKDINASLGTSTPRRDSVSKVKKEDTVASPLPARRKTRPKEEEALSVDVGSGVEDNAKVERPGTPVLAKERKEDSVDEASLLGSSPKDGSFEKPKKLNDKLKRVTLPDTVESEEDIIIDDDKDDDEDEYDINSEGYDEWKKQKERIRKEKERLKREEEKLKKDASLHKKKAKEEQRDNWKREKERLKKEKEEALRRVKEDLKKEEQKLYRKTDSEDNDIMSGWIKMRSPLKNWHMRYFVLIPGKLIYYRDEFEKACLGIILLHGCETSIRKSKKDGFCFKIWHPKQANIYSSKGLKGESLASGMVPVSADHCILRVTTEEERAKWMQGLAQSIILGKSKRKASASRNLEDDSKVDTEDELATKLDSSPSQTVLSTSPSVSKTIEEIRENLPVADNKDEIQPELNNDKQVVSVFKPPRAVKETRYVTENVDANVGESGVKEEQLGSESNSLIMSLLKQVKIGMDLSRVALPTFILEPRSMLEKLSDFMAHAELLTAVPTIKDPLGRIIGLLKWYLSGFYIKPEGVKKPYNPIIGEIFRAMWVHKENDSKTFYVGEQVSHHPPISAFYASNRKAGFIINGSLLARSKFLGTSAASILDGFASIYITPYDEEYEITFPSVYAKGFLFGTLLMELVGPVQVVCKKTGYIAEVEFKAKPVIGGDYNVIHAKIKQGNETLYTVRGKWDSQIEIKNTKTKETEILWEPTPEIRKNRLPKYKPAKEEMKDNESDKLWAKVTEAIKKGDQRVATDEKIVLEDAQREGAKRREQLGIEYKPKLFRKDENGIWVYKYANKAPFNTAEEIEEYENEGIVRSKVVHEEGSEDDSEDEDVEPLPNGKAVVLLQRKEPSPIAAAPSEPEPIAIVQQVDGIKTHLSSMRASVDNDWKKQVEIRLLAIEKSLIALQHKRPEVVQHKPKTGNTKMLVLVIVALLFIYYMK